MKYNTALNARILPDTYKDLRTLAKKEKKNFSKTVREILELGLKMKKAQKTLQDMGLAG